MHEYLTKAIRMSKIFGKELHLKNVSVCTPEGDIYSQHEEEPDVIFVLEEHMAPDILEMYFLQEYCNLLFSLDGYANIQEKSVLAQNFSRFTRRKFDVDSAHQIAALIAGANPVSFFTYLDYEKARQLDSNDQRLHPYIIASFNARAAFALQFSLEGVAPDPTQHLLELTQQLV